MDPDTQSAYRVVSIRARAACYAARQLEFRRRAKRAVAAATFDRLDATRALKVRGGGVGRRGAGGRGAAASPPSCPPRGQEGREELRERTAEGLRRALSGRRALEEQQERLAGQQGRLEASIRRAVPQRALEERLADGGRRRAARLVEGVARSVGKSCRPGGPTRPRRALWARRGFWRRERQREPGGAGRGAAGRAASHPGRPPPHAGKSSGRLRPARWEHGDPASRVFWDAPVIRGVVPSACGQGRSPCPRVLGA